MLKDSQLKVAETFLQTAVNSGLLESEACHEILVLANHHEDRLLSFKEAQNRLGVSRMTIHRLTLSGELIKVKIGKLARVTEQSLEKLIERGKV